MVSTHEPRLAAATRDGLEMIRLADADWRVPRIARHLGLHEQTMRTWLKVFLTAGFAALPNQSHARPHSALNPQLLDLTRTMIRSSGRTWTGGRVAAWLAQEHDVPLSAARVCFHLRRAGLSYQRTSRSVRHKQDLVAVQSHPAKRTDRQKAADGLIDVCHLDEVGFSPTLVTS